MPETINAELMHGFKRLLRDQQTQQYFTGYGWSSNPSDARQFADEMEAVRTCVEQELKGVDLVLRYKADGPDVFSTPIR